MNNNYSSTILSFHLYSYLKKKTSHKTMLHTHMHLRGSISTLVSLPISCVVVLLIYGTITIVLFSRIYYYYNLINLKSYHLQGGA